MDHVCEHTGISKSPEKIVLLFPRFSITYGSTVIVVTNRNHCVQSGTKFFRITKEFHQIFFFTLELDLLQFHNSCCIKYLIVIISIRLLQ